MCVCVCGAVAQLVRVHLENPGPCRVAGSSHSDGEL